MPATSLFIISGKRSLQVTICLSVRQLHCTTLNAYRNTCSIRPRHSETSPPRLIRIFTRQQLKLCLNMLLTLWMQEYPNGLPSSALSPDINCSVYQARINVAPLSLSFFLTFFLPYLLNKFSSSRYSILLFFFYSLFSLFHLFLFLSLSFVLCFLVSFFPSINSLIIITFLSQSSFTLYLSFDLSLSSFSLSSSVYTIP